MIFSMKKEADIDYSSVHGMLADKAKGEPVLYKLGYTVKISDGGTRLEHTTLKLCNKYIYSIGITYTICTFFYFLFGHTVQDTVWSINLGLPDSILSPTLFYYHKSSFTIITIIHDYKFIDVCSCHSGILYKKF
jgi:hypothetical protein